MKFNLAIIVLCMTVTVHAKQQDGDDKSDIGKNFQATLRRLEKEIAAVRGLEFKTPVQGKIIPRPADAAKGTQGYYSPSEKTLFLYDDVKSNYQVGVLIHEMVHALQDQHFNLTRLQAQLHQEKFASDAELALAALIEGDATFTMIEVMKKENPKVAAMLDIPLSEAKNLQNAFLYAQGARYVKALKDRGGWASVNFSYKFPPRNTATIFNLGAVSALDLGPGKVHGAYALYQKFLQDSATRTVAEHAAKSWRGERSKSLESGQLAMLAFANKEAAVLVLEALIKSKEEKLKNRKLHHKDASGTTWIAGDMSVHGILLRGQRVVSVEAINEAGFKSLLDYLDGPPQLTIFAAGSKQPISFGAMVERLLNVDMICIGESHDAELHHRVQLQVIKALFAHDERLGVGMEMFQRPFQKHIDRYMNGECAEDEFLKTTEYQQRWGYDWHLYRPIVEFSRRNQIPLAGLNAPKELTSRISKVTYAGLTDDEKKQLGPIDFNVKEHRDYWFDRISKMHGDDKATNEQKERTYQVMTTWDEYMAASAAQFQQERKLRRLVVLAGSGHIDRGFGIPQRAVKRAGGKAATIRIEYDRAIDSTVKSPITDYVVVIH